MKVEKIDRIALTVNNLDFAIRLFSTVFGTTFDTVHDKIEKGKVKQERKITEYADKAFEETEKKVALSPMGLELIETIPPTEKEGVRSFHFKVSNLDEAMAEMERKGIRLIGEIKIGGLREAIYSPEDLHGARILLVEYETPTAMGAILQK